MERTPKNALSMELTGALLTEYFFGKKKMPSHDDCVKIYNAIRIHANGEFPGDIITERRPHESEEVREYRKKLYKPINKKTIGRVIKSINKIRRSTDWKISYDKDGIPPKITAEETLEKYCENKFPYFDSLTNWVFKVLLRNYLVDPNGLVLIKPLVSEIEDNQYFKPFPFIYNSDQIFEYVEDSHCILKSKQKHTVDNKQYDKWIQVTENEIITYAITDSKSYIEIERYEHFLGYLPIIRFTSVFIRSIDNYPIYESHLSDMIPMLDEAVREYNDQQANVVSHMFLERWEYASLNCTECMNEAGISTGKVKIETGTGQKKKIQTVSCKSCNGTGYMSNSGPFKKHIVRPVNKNMGEVEMPTPPFGYGEKDTAIIEVIDKRIEKHQYEALSAINMQFLMQVPLSISGDAKEVDRDELNNFFHGVAEDMVNLMDKHYRIICDYRYSVLVPEENKRMAMLPKVAVPEKFDILSSNYLADESKAARDAKMSGVIVAQLDIEYAEKKFYSNPEIRDELMCVFDLDPMLGATEDEKMLRLQNGGVTKPDYVLSCNIVPFVKKAILTDKDFLSKPYEEKLKVVMGYAEEKINAQKSNLIPTPDEHIAGGGNILSNDDVGKIPLALQQMALARERALNANDKNLANEIGKKMRELIPSIEI